ncbi:MAG: hypothetical protein ACI8ZM_005759, partial [Crocinitomix sp.]
YMVMNIIGLLFISCRKDDFSCNKERLAGNYYCSSLDSEITLDQEWDPKGRFF